MAKKTRDEDKLNYSAEIRRLNEDGPQRIYLLWGPEDYLREQYLMRLKEVCLPEGEDSFSFKRMDGPDVDMDELAEAVDALPFMTERTFVELRGIDLNKLKEGDRFLSILSDVPEYCTVVLVQSAQFEPDGRIKLVKNLRAIAYELKFTHQSQDQLIKWVARRFSAAGKGIELDAIQRLIFISGDLMNMLIPEIEKVAAYAKGDKVTVADVDAVANHVPEAVIFELTDYIAEKKYNNAVSVLAELLSDKNNEPIAMMGLLGQQMRKLYAARLAIDMELGKKFVSDQCGIKYDFLVNKLLASARGFTLPQLIRAVELCAETDYAMKSSGEDDRALLKEAVLRIAAGEA